MKAECFYQRESNPEPGGGYSGKLTKRKECLSLLGCYSKPTNKCYQRFERAYWLQPERHQWHDFVFISVISGNLVHDPLTGEIITAVSSTANGLLLKLVQKQTIALICNRFFFIISFQGQIKCVATT
jgi:hypothetical protein